MAKRKKPGARCRAGTKAGKRCKRAVAPGSTRCNQHPKTDRRGPVKGAGGRPKKGLTKDQWTTLDIMCNSGVPQPDIAEAMRLDVKTLTAICKRDRGAASFSHYRRQKRGSGRAALAGKQFEVAMSGNVAMLIWLGKQWLDQKEPARDPKLVLLPPVVDIDPEERLVSHDDRVLRLVTVAEGLRSGSESG